MVSVHLWGWQRAGTQCCPARGDFIPTRSANTAWGTAVSLLWVPRWRELRGLRSTAGVAGRRRAVGMGSGRAALRCAALPRAVRVRTRLCFALPLLPPAGRCRDYMYWREGVTVADLMEEKKSRLRCFGRSSSKHGKTRAGVRCAAAVCQPCVCCVRLSKPLLCAFSGRLQHGDAGACGAAG